MKEIKAYVRPVRLGTILHELEAAGARDITVIRVDAIGVIADPEQDRKRFVRAYAERYSAAAKLEIVCRDEEAERFVRIIQEHARTGGPGDGRVFVSAIERAINIRMGTEGPEAL